MIMIVPSFKATAMISTRFDDSMVEIVVFLAFILSEIAGYW